MELPYSKVRTLLRCCCVVILDPRPGISFIIYIQFTNWFLKTIVKIMLLGYKNKLKIHVCQYGVFIYKVYNFTRILKTINLILQVRVYARAEDQERIEYAVEAAAKIIHFYGRFFNISYPLPKLGKLFIFHLSIFFIETFFSHINV